MLFTNIMITLKKGIRKNLLIVFLLIAISFFSKNFEDYLTYESDYSSFTVRKLEVNPDEFKDFRIKYETRMITLESSKTKIYILEFKNIWELTKFWYSFFKYEVGALKTFYSTIPFLYGEIRESRNDLYIIAWFDLFNNLLFYIESESSEIALKEFRKIKKGKW